MPPSQRETWTIRNAELLWPNFQGEKRQFNPQGMRNFSIKLNEEQARDLENAGFNVKPLRRREEDEEQAYHLQIKVNFGGRAPQIWFITSGGRTLLGEGLVGMLDDTYFEKVDLIFAEYQYTVRGASGKSAYLQSMYATVYEDELALEYSNVPQLGAAGDGAPPEITSGVNRNFDYEGDVVEEVVR